MDHWKMSFSDLSNFLADCEYMFERKWEPIFLDGNAYEKPSDAYLCHIVNTLYKHNYKGRYQIHIEKNVTISNTLHR